MIEEKKMKEIVSYGGGTQSTAMILMALNGKFDLPRPDFAVFADTGDEPEFVNEYVKYFIDLVKHHYDFDIYTTKHKNGLSNHLLSPPQKSRDGRFYTSSVPPFFTLDENGKKGMLMRQCTSDFKTNPLSKLINSKLKRAEPYRLWIGMSFDERSRMKVSNLKRRTNYYPLVDNFVNRIDSINYVKLLGVKPAQRSSCVFCPFHSDRYWVWLKKYHSSEFQRAVDFEIKIQAQANWDYSKTKYFLHSDCKPLSEVVFANKNQLNIFPELIDECDGLCGI